MCVYISVMSSVGFKVFFLVSLFAHRLWHIKKLYFGLLYLFKVISIQSVVVRYIPSHFECQRMKHRKLWNLEIGIDDLFLFTKPFFY